MHLPRRRPRLVGARCLGRLLVTSVARERKNSEETESERCTRLAADAALLVALVAVAWVYERKEALPSVAGKGVASGPPVNPERSRGSRTLDFVLYTVKTVLHSPIGMHRTIESARDGKDRTNEGEKRERSVNVRE